MNDPVDLDGFDVSWAYKGAPRSPHTQAAVEQAHVAWEHGADVIDRFDQVRDGRSHDIVGLLHDAVAIAETLRACWDQVAASSNPTVVRQVAHMIATLEAVRDWIDAYGGQQATSTR